jgi:hypothetical protein
MASDWFSSMWKRSDEASDKLCWQKGFCLCGGGVRREFPAEWERDFLQRWLPSEARARLCCKSNYERLRVGVVRFDLFVHIVVVCVQRHRKTPLREEPHLEGKDWFQGCATLPHIVQPYIEFHAHVQCFLDSAAPCVLWMQGLWNEKHGCSYWLDAPSSFSSIDAMQLKVMIVNSTSATVTSQGLWLQG